MNTKKEALAAWDIAAKDYEHMNRDSWTRLYPGWRTTVKAHFLLGWIAGFNSDVELRNKILDTRAQGDEAQMTTIPFMHGFGEGYLSTFDDVDVIDVESRQVIPLLESNQDSQ
ncbi:hypothetical protein [Dendronalium sp. ChiSLP03b]|uniref:hypothetical protein n=1 Tax=Dendronalium sp. ChiSLP03b TaxID=3075381 RepID=UPI00391B7EDB